MKVNDTQKFLNLFLLFHRIFLSFFKIPWSKVLVATDLFCFGDFSVMTRTTALWIQRFVTQIRVKGEKNGNRWILKQFCERRKQPKFHPKFASWTIITTLIIWLLIKTRFICYAHFHFQLFWGWKVSTKFNLPIKSLLFFQTMFLKKGRGKDESDVKRLQFGKVQFSFISNFLGIFNASEKFNLIQFINTTWEFLPVACIVTLFKISPNSTKILFSK